MGNIFVVTKVSTLLIITWVSSGLKEITYVNLSLANVKSCVTMGPISLMENVWPCIVPVD